MLKRRCASIDQLTWYARVQQFTTSPSSDTPKNIQGCQKSCKDRECDLTYAYRLHICALAKQQFQDDDNMDIKLQHKFEIINSFDI